MVVFSSDWTGPPPISSLPNHGPPPINLPNHDGAPPINLPNHDPPPPIPSLPKEGPPPINLRMESAPSVARSSESSLDDRSPHAIKSPLWRRRLSVIDKSPNVNEEQVSIANANTYGEQPRDVNNAAPFLERDEEARGKTVGYEVY